MLINSLKPGAWIVLMLLSTALQAEVQSDEVLSEQPEVLIEETETEVPLEDQSPSIKAKFGSGLTVTTANESFRFQIRARMQSLVQVEHMYDSDEKAEFGAQIRRARLKLGGYVGRGKENKDDVIDPKHRLNYDIQLGLANRDIGGISDGRGFILDAYITYAPCSHLDIVFGQTKLPGNRENIMSSQKMEFVDRSYTSGFRLDRDFGIQFQGNFGEQFVFKPTFSVAVGEGRNITALSTSGLDYTFRTEFLPLGEFKKGSGDYVGADVDREPEPKLAFAASYDLNHNARFSRGQRGGNEIAAGDRTTIHTVFADAIFKYKGFNIFGEFAHRTVGMDYRSDYSTGNAVTASAGYVCEKQFGVSFRYSREMPLDNLQMDSDMRTGTNAYTIAASKYFFSHNLKIQTDYTIFDEVNADILSGLWRFQVEVAF